MTKASQSRYRVAGSTTRLCEILEIDLQAVMRRAGRQNYNLHSEKRGMKTADYYSLWDAVLSEADRADAPLFLGLALARAPLSASLHAFACSHTLATGIERLAVLRPLAAPLTIRLTRGAEQALEICKTSSCASVSMPPSFAAVEMICMIALARGCADHQVTPCATTLPDCVSGRDDIADYLGCAITEGRDATLTLAAEDADRPLVSSDPENRHRLDDDFRPMAPVRHGDETDAARLRATLTDILPAGHADIGSAAARMGLSSRTLQRRLNRAGTGYQAELDTTREAMARFYLTESSLSVPEISNMLAYGDPNSFYRAFQGWTGTTPQAMRAGLN